MANENFTKHSLKKKLRDQFWEYQEKLICRWNQFKIFGIDSKVVNKRSDQSRENLKTCLVELQDILNDMLLESRIGNRCKTFSIEELKQIEAMKSTIPGGSYEVDYKIRDLFKQNVLNILKSSHFRLLSKLMSDQNTAICTFYIIEKIYEANCTSTHPSIDYDDLVKAVMEPRPANSTTTNISCKENDKYFILQDNAIMTNHTTNDLRHIEPPLRIVIDKEDQEEPIVYKDETYQWYMSTMYPFELQFDGEFDLHEMYEIDENINTSIFDDDLLNKTMRHIEMDDCGNDK